MDAKKAKYPIEREVVLEWSIVERDAQPKRMLKNLGFDAMLARSLELARNTHFLIIIFFS